MKSTRKVERETSATFFERSQYRPVVVTIDPERGLVGFRLKGTRRTYELNAGTLYRLAVTADVESQERAKR
ncbi:MAG TPA: hypothetical protein VK422_16940 [Pyrinomonadaceae bacterium]|nr:hypothetical protein [Pyrinomonadaceae bacterium]